MATNIPTLLRLFQKCHLAPLMEIRPVVIKICLIAIIASLLPALNGCVTTTPRLAVAYQRLVAYLPSYRMNSIQPEWFAAIDDLLLYNITPQGSGDLDRSNFSPDALRIIQGKRAKTGMRILITVGGWHDSSGFSQMTSDPNRRKRFIKQLLSFCRTNNLDGVDYDWEFPATTSEEAAYAALLIETKQLFAGHRLAVTVAVAHNQRLSSAAYQAVDQVHLMSYDHGRHLPTFEASKADIQRQLSFGVPREKIYLGIPFFGRHRLNDDKVKSYAELSLRHHPANDIDELDGYYFNGLATVQKKVAYAQQQGLAGIMVWELGQDETGERSLLNAIDKALPPGRKRFK